MIHTLLIAAEGAGSIDWVQILSQGGPWAIFVLLIIMNKLVPQGSHDRVIKENEQLKVKLERIEKVFEEQVIPAMVRYSDSLSRRVDQ